MYHSFFHSYSCSPPKSVWIWISLCFENGQVVYCHRRADHQFQACLVNSAQTQSEQARTAFLLLALPIFHGNTSLYNNLYLRILVCFPRAIQKIHCISFPPASKPHPSLISGLNICLCLLLWKRDLAMPNQSPGVSLLPCCPSS